MQLMRTTINILEAEMPEVLKVLRIPEGDIVVTRKVPMTDATCTQLREIKASREQTLSEDLGEEFRLEIPTLIAQLISEEHQRLRG